MRLSHSISVVLLVVLVSIFEGCDTENTLLEDPFQPTTNNSNGNTQSSPNNWTDDENNYYNAQSTVADVINDPAFADFGRLLFPVDRNVASSMTLAQVSTSSVYMWYPYIQVEKTVEILNYLHSQAARGETIFYNIYSTEEIASNRSKADTGIFVFKGDNGNPFAITNAGGGFAYFGAMHDSFPHSLELCKAGYTAFALIYRPDDPYNDLALSLIHI